jgi:uncharacterized protein (DUF2252 family)
MRARPSTWLLPLLLSGLAALQPACAPDLSERARTIAAAMSAADAVALRDRPSLVAGKYNHMARGLYNFYRGAVPLYRVDFRDGRLPASRTVFPSSALPWSTGDAHPENFGLLTASDGTLALEPNDLDGVDRYPYHWDLRRLCTGMILGARLSNPSDPAANAAAIAAERAIAEAAALGYAEAIVAYADGAPLERFDDGAGVPMLVDLFRRGNRDLVARAELSDRTVLVDGVRRLIRGNIDSAEPENAQADLSIDVVAALPELLARVRLSMPTPPPLAELQVLDAVREFGSGVASWPRVRIVVLVRGPSDDPADDVLLQVKEISDSGAEGFYPPGRFGDDVPDRVRRGRGIWARLDGDRRWTADTWLGLPVLVRTESEAHKTLRVARMEDELGTPEALTALARTLGALLARMHASSVDGEPSPAPSIAGILRDDPAAFAADHADEALALADQTVRDFEAFREALRVLGPTLGLSRSVTAPPLPADLRALFGSPPPIVPFE